MPKNIIVRFLGDTDPIEASVTALGGKLDKLLPVAVGTAVAGAVVGLYKLGASFDEQYDKIRVATGATGATLDGLKGIFKDVVRDVPTDFGHAGDAISNLAQRVGDATNGQLKGLAEQQLELARITKTDLTGNIAASEDAFKNWGITVDAQPGKLDALFRASQVSGLSVSDLAGRLSDSGVVLRSVGFDFEHATGLIASMSQAGVDVADIMPALSKSLAVAAKEGKSAADVFQTTLDSIKAAPDDTAAAGIALDVFGAKAGPKLAAMIREGKLSYEDFTAAISGGKDTIVGAGKDTMDFSEKWQMFKNKVLVAIEPIATKVFNAIGTAMDKIPPIATRIVTVGKGVVEFFKQHRSILIGVAAAIMAMLIPAFVSWAIAAGTAAIATIAAAAPVIALGLALAALGAGIAWLVTHWRQAWDAVQSAVGSAVDFVKGLINGAIDWFKSNWQNILGTILLGPIWLFRDQIPGVLDTVLGFFTSLPGRILGALGDLGGLLLGAGRLLDGFVGGAEAAWNAFVDFWNGISIHVPGIHIPLVGTVGDFNVGLPNLPHLATGGDITSGGWVVTGEEGPEPVYLPAGACVLPHSAMRDHARHGQPTVIQVYAETNASPWDIGKEIEWAMKTSGR